ncbi:hypothetical protein WDU94_013769, partial [Cyamophila willieti]
SYQKVVENIFDLELYNKHFIFSYFFCILNRYKTVAVSAGPAGRFLPKVSCCVPYLEVTFISNFKSLALTVLEIS